MIMPKYVGNRCIPRPEGEWDKNKEYENLSIVLASDGNSYTSKKNVPKGIELKNTEYWVISGNYNAQVENYKETVENYKNETDNKINLLSNYITAEAFGAKGDGTTDDTIALQNAINYSATNKIPLLLLAKKYSFSNTLNVPQGCKIIGNMRERLWVNTPTTELYFVNNGNVEAIKINENADSFNNYNTPNYSHVTLKNITLTTTGGFCGINVSGYEHILENVCINNFAIGLYIIGNYKSIFKNITCLRCDIGCFIAPNTNSNSILENCWFQFGSNIQENTSLDIRIKTKINNVYTDKKCGIYMNRGSITAKALSVEGTSFGIFIVNDSKIRIDRLGAELITDCIVYCDNEGQYPTVLIDELSMYNANGYNGKIARASYLSTVIIKSSFDFPANFTEPDILQSKTYIQFKNKTFTSPITFQNIDATIVQNNSYYIGNKFYIDIVVTYDTYDSNKPVIINVPPIEKINVGLITSDSESFIFNAEYKTIIKSDTSYGFPKSGSRILLCLNTL